MQLSDLIQNEHAKNIRVDRVIYDENAHTAHFLLSGEGEKPDCRKMEQALSDIFPCEIHVTYRMETPAAISDYYETPISVVQAAHSSQPVQKTETNGDFQVGRFRKNDLETIIRIEEVQQDLGYCVTRGTVTQIEKIVTKSGKALYRFRLENIYGGALSCKMFCNPNEAEKVDQSVHKGSGVIVRGQLQFDTFQKMNLFSVTAMQPGTVEKIEDSSPEKRIEFAVHTQMSNMEGLIDIGTLKNTLKSWGHEAVGVADTGSVQAFPLLAQALQGTGIKPLYGYKAKILRKEHHILINLFDLDIHPLIGKYTVFDLETTGFSRFNDAIIEIGAVRYENGEKVGEFSEFVHPGRLIPRHITELTSITDAMVQGADSIEKVLPRFLEFAKDSIWVGHNADFDVSFIRENAHRLNLTCEPVYMDTLGLSRCLHPEYKNHKLNTITKELRVPLMHHHRAIDDATATGFAFQALIREWKELGIDWTNINETPSEFPRCRHNEYRSMIYVQKQSGLKNLYEMVSAANTEFFYREPGLPEEMLAQKRDGLLIMTGFVGSELFEAISLRFPHKKLLEIAAKADVLCVEPPIFTEKALMRELVSDQEHYKSLVEQVIRLSEELKKPCIAIGEPCYLNPGERLAYNVLRNYQRRTEFDHNGRYRFFTTEEMLGEFSWLPEYLARQLVVDTPKRLAESFEEVHPIPDGTFTPELPGADEELRTMAETTAKSIYGDPLPEVVEKRLERELKSIIENGYSSLYVIAQRLVKKSNLDGYLVGSRGSVGSSFAATMSGITEVNPLVPHYICTHCRHSEFIEDGSYESGFDLPPKNCPECGTPMERNGHTIPFEVFLGFNGDKEPDIDLNFAGEYMSTIHKYTEELFGQGKVFRAGTISGIQSKTAFGMIKKYMEQSYIPDEDHMLTEARIASLQGMLEGTKRTTGQHAGGLMIVPQSMDIYDFCPIQFPADDVKSDVRTTHFSYKNLSGRMLKLDELGHTSPTVIRQLEEMTGIDPLSISFDDDLTMSIFSSAKALNAKHEYSNSDDGSLGIPEFGTRFVRGMLKDTSPTTFGELCRISGLSHGTDVWLHNAQDLIREGKTDLSHAICTRDDIMTYLIHMGMDKLESFKTMEAVRKGKGIPEGVIPHMKEHGVPDWYIDSCQRIQYMFPKAHATAYVMMSYRIAWFKVHQPAAFYATYFTQHLSEFSTECLFQSLDQVQSVMKSDNENGDAAESDKYSLYELIEEMYARGIRFAPVNLMKSDAAKFIVLDENTVLPPFSALNDVSEANGYAIAEERDRGEFLSQNDFKERTKINKSVMASLMENGLLDAFPESNQMSFFSGMGDFT